MCRTHSRLKVNVTIEDHDFEIWIVCPLHISFTAVRTSIKLWLCVRLRCAEPMTQPCQLKVKVKVEGHEFGPWISCPLYISFTPGRIFFKRRSNVCLSKAMCRTYKSTMLNQGQVHNWRSRVWALNFIFYAIGWILIKFVLLSETMCKTHDSTCCLKIKVSVEGHEF